MLKAGRSRDNLWFVMEPSEEAGMSRIPPDGPDNCVVQQPGAGAQWSGSSTRCKHKTLVNQVKLKEVLALDEWPAC